MTLHLTTAAFFIISSLYGGLTPASGTPLPVASETEIRQAALVYQPLTLEEYVREYYRDTPILAEIARCETRFRHIGRGGRIIRGELSVDDIGVMQINEFYHGERADKLGFDLHALEGNLSYAKWLYQREGITPWLPSAQCWQEFEQLALGTPKGESHRD